MHDIMKWRKDGYLDKMDFKTVMPEAATQARELQQEWGAYQCENYQKCLYDANKILHKRNVNDPTILRFSKPKKMNTVVMNIVLATTEGSSGLKKKREHDNIPLCLNDKCWSTGGRRFVQRCLDSNNALNNKLKEEYRRKNEQD